ncbi:unnamed protein product, partial [Polarella glacialis]
TDLGSNARGQPQGRLWPILGSVVLAGEFRHDQQPVDGSTPAALPTWCPTTERHTHRARADAGQDCLGR